MIQQRKQTGGRGMVSTLCFKQEYKDGFFRILFYVSENNVPLKLLLGKGFLPLTHTNKFEFLQGYNS